MAVSFKDLHSDALPCIPTLSSLSSLGSILWMTHLSFRCIIFKLLFVDHLLDRSRDFHFDDC